MSLFHQIFDFNLRCALFLHRVIQFLFSLPRNEVETHFLKAGFFSLRQMLECMTYMINKKQSWIGFIQRFSRHPKHYPLNPLFIHTGGSRLHVQPQLPWGKLTAAWLPICAKRPLRPPPNIHSHSHKAMWVRCLAQGHNNRLRCSGICTANQSVIGQPTVPPELPQIEDLYLRSVAWFCT